MTICIHTTCVIELVFVMEWFYSCITMVFGWGEGGLKSLMMVGFGDFVVVKNGYNSCYKE